MRHEDPTPSAQAGATWEAGKLAWVMAVLVVLALALTPAAAMAYYGGHRTPDVRAHRHVGRRHHKPRRRHHNRSRRHAHGRKGSRPCDLYAKAGTPCEAAFSSSRALFAGYAGPLYEVKRASDGATLKIRVLARGGYANAAAQNAFCAGTSCVVAKIYDQTANHSDLVPQGPTTAVYSNTTYSHDPVSANALPILAGSHPVYGLKFQSGSPTGLPCPTAATCIDNRGAAYNNGHVRAKGIAVNGQAESVYGVFGGTYSGSDCCFDFGNSEIAGTDNGNGTMDALNFSRDCWDACGPAGGPWVQADLENGMFMTGTTTPTPEAPTAFIGGSFESGDGWCCAATSHNAAMPYRFVTGMLDNPGAKTFTIKGANATAGGLTTFYSGPTPPGNGYSPMRQEGAIILGSGGDQGTTNGEFFEGIMTIGLPPAATEAAVQANIVAVGYKMR
jgi:non-reducing end alpha-L-arabinofuranosidase